jgi:hypothetical protein
MLHHSDRLFVSLLARIAKYEIVDFEGAPVS